MNAWKFVSTEDQALWEDQHLGPLARSWQVLDAEEGDSNLKQAAYWGGQVGEAVIKDAYWIPLGYPKVVALTQPDVTHLMPNPRVWPGFAQLQYATVK